MAIFAISIIVTNEVIAKNIANGTLWSEVLESGMWCVQI